MDTTSANKTNTKQASLFCDHLHNELGLPMAAQAIQSVTQFPFCKLSAQSMQADTFQDFPISLMSVDKTLDNGMVQSSRRRVSMYSRKEDILITCKGEPILIGIQDNQGQYQTLLMQQWGHLQPRRPSKQAQKALRQANSIYDLPLTE